jgi:hypothetical protein
MDIVPFFMLVVGRAPVVFVDAEESTMFGCWSLPMVSA